MPATCFPTAATTACSFDTELITRMGEALGEECLQENVSVLLGPGVNIKRSPLCGRNFEYFSEDPFLTGKMAAALIRGVQSKGIGTSMKHYAANNQEKRRMVINSVIDERAMREIYLAGFETAVKEAKPWTLMCSYNQINGEFGSQNKTLLTDILRNEWGFEGAVMTDWGAAVDRVKGLKAGLDLEMPYSGPDNDTAIVEAVKNNTLQEETVDIAVQRMLCLLLASQDHNDTQHKYNIQAHNELAREVAAGSIVLLKNEEVILPITSSQTIALVGAFAKQPRYQGAGSSRINPTSLDNLYDVLTERGSKVLYAPGYSLTGDNAKESLLTEAAEAAQKAEIALVCIGLPDEYESEGFDRDHMQLPESHVALLEKVASVNKNTIVLLYSGSAVEMPWIEQAKAVMMLYLGGQAGSAAAADIIFGKISPSGKLAESFPITLEDNPSHLYFPGGDKTVEYRESIYVGYRYYDKADVLVRFPFGYGLSYTAFVYRDMNVVNEGEEVIVTLKVKNTGKLSGAEAVQIYVSQKNPSIFRPNRELKGFSKVFLAPNEEKEVRIVLDRRAFACYHTDIKDWCVETDTYIIAAAASSRDIRLETEVNLDGISISDRSETNQLNSYIAPSKPFAASQEDFTLLYGEQLPSADRLKGEEYTMNSTLGEIAETQTGKALLGQMKQSLEGMAGDNIEGDDSMGRMFERMMMDMPVRALTMFSQGTMGKKQINEVLMAINQEIKIQE